MVPSSCDCCKLNSAEILAGILVGEACDIKPPDEPAGTMDSQPLELQKVTPADSTAIDTSCELYGNGSSQPPKPVRSESMAGAVRSYSNETAGVTITI